MQQHETKSPPPHCSWVPILQVLEIVKLKFVLPALPHILLHLVYKSGIVLITLYTLLIVSKSVVSFSAHTRLIFSQNCIKKILNYCDVMKVPEVI
jgi:hypothetical protein